MESTLRAYSAPPPGSSNSNKILNPITSAPNRIFSSRIPNAKVFGGDPTDAAEVSSGSLHEKLQCGQAAGISRISSGDTVSRDLHLWHSNVIARISSNPTTILRSNVTLPEVYHARARQSERHSMEPGASPPPQLHNVQQTSPHHRRARNRQHPSPHNPSRHARTHRRQSVRGANSHNRPRNRVRGANRNPKMRCTNQVTAPAVSAENPPNGVSFVIRCPIVLMIRHPPAIVPPAIAR